MTEWRRRGAASRTAAARCGGHGVLRRGGRSALAPQPRDGGRRGPRPRDTDGGRRRSAWASPPRSTSAPRNWATPRRVDSVSPRCSYPSPSASCTRSSWARGAHLATAARRGAARPARAPRAAGRGAATARPGGDVAAGLTAVTLLGGALLADPSGRRVTLGAATASPFPGLFYGRPAGVGLIALTAARGRRPVDRREPARRGHRGRQGGDRPPGGLGAPGAAGGRRGAAARHRRPALRRRERPALRGVEQRRLGGARRRRHGRGLLGMVALLAGVVACCLPAPSVPADAPAVPAG